MLFMPRILVVAGAILASVRHSSPPEPGSPTSHYFQGSHRALNALRVLAHPSPPASRLSPYFSVSRLIRSKGRIRWRRSTTIPSVSNHHASYPYSQLLPSTGLLYKNQTLEGPHSVLFGPTNYSGPKQLALIDERRALTLYRSDRSSALASHSRPSSLTLYTGPINYIQFWIDPRHYDIVVSLYRMRFVNSAPMFSQYTHLEPRDFDQCAYHPSHHPLETMLAADRSILLEVFNLVPLKRLTIGVFDREPVERASRTLAHIYALGFIVSLLLVAHDEYLELQKVMGLNRSLDLVQVHEFNFDASYCIHTQIKLGETRDAIVAEQKWWETDTEEQWDVQVDCTTTYVDKSISDPMSSSTSTSTCDPATAPIPTKPSQVPGSSRQPFGNPSQRPSGPRFKSAAWKRCRVK
ncbi:hypothetical protein OPQ81_003697 [Rhizoctonia solani]|nr:hypothetical protein OPQ81_003697 [Rhizoctonia solani]